MNEIDDKNHTLPDGTVPDFALSCGHHANNTVADPENPGYTVCAVCAWLRNDELPIAKLIDELVTELVGIGTEYYGDYKAPQRVNDLIRRAEQWRGRIAP